MAGKTLGERMVAVETWQGDHERRCDDRQAALGREIRDMKGVMSGFTKAAWTVVAALLAWLALQVYGNLAQRPAPQAPSSATATVRVIR